MNPKIVKLQEERTRNCAKIEKLTERNRAIDVTVRSLENSDIIGLVREQGLTPDKLARLLAALQSAPMPTGDATTQGDDMAQKEEGLYETEGN
jgi:hypothetical protein